MQQNFSRLVILSVGFLLMFTSFNTAQALAAKVLQENDFGNLGFYSLAVLYGVFGLACFVSLPMVKFLGPRMSFVIGSFCYSLYVASFILPALKFENPYTSHWYYNSKFIIASILMAAVVNGIGAAMLWVAQGWYISQCANESNKGFYNSFFWAVFQMNFLVGNFSAAYLLTSVTQSTFYTVMTGTVIAASLFFLLLSTPVQEKTQEVIQTSVRQDIKETLELLLSPRMIKLWPIMTWTSINGVGIQAGVFVPLMSKTMQNNPETNHWEESHQSKYCLLALIGVGCGEIVGAMLLGKIQDRFGNIVAVYSCLLLSLIGMSYILIYIYFYSFTLPAAFTMTLIYGIQDGAVNCLVNCILGFQFQQQSTPFSVMKFIQSFCSFIIICSTSLLTTRAHFTIFVCFAAGYGFFSYLVVALTFDFRKADIKQDDYQRLNNSRDNEDMDDFYQNEVLEKSGIQLLERCDQGFERSEAGPFGATTRKSIDTGRLRRDTGVFLD